MSQQILQVNLKFSIPRTDLETAWLDAAQPIADTPGLLWKVWLMNEAESEAGGIYLFENEAAVRSYLGGPIVAALKDLRDSAANAAGFRIVALALTGERHMSREEVLATAGVIYVLYRREFRSEVLEVLTS